MPPPIEFGALPLGEGVALRRWHGEDAPALAEACDDPEIARWLPFPSPYTIDAARSFLATTEAEWSAGEAFAFAIADGRSIHGAIAIRRKADQPSIGYWLASSARGRGIATRAVEALTDWAGTVLDLTEVWIFAQPHNVASCRVARRAGYVEQDQRIVAPDGNPRAVFYRRLARPTPTSRAGAR